MPNAMNILLKTKDKKMALVCDAVPFSVNLRSVEQLPG